MVVKINLALFLFFCALSSQGQPSSLGALEATSSNHVVIGAFGTRENAVHLTDDVRASYPEVKFEMNPLRQLYYVYVLRTDNRVQAFAQARTLRKESKYWDTWVYYGTLGQNLGSGDVNLIASAGQGNEALETVGNSRKDPVSGKDENIVAAEVKAYSMGDESAGLDLNKEISNAQSQAQKEHYKAIQEVKNSAAMLDASTKVIVFKDDAEGREALRSLGYDIEEGKPVGGFFDSKNNILAINATESPTDEPFHEGLKPVVKFLKKKNPELFESFAQQASAMKHPTKGKVYGDLYTTSEEALASMMVDVAKGYFENASGLKGEATTLMQKIIESLGIEVPESALNSEHLKVTANNLAVAVREATGFDADGNRKFRFNLYETKNLSKVVGEVDLVNEAGKKLNSYPGNDVVRVMRADASGNIILACEVLGYRKVLFKLNYDNPFLTDGVERGEDEEAIVSFGLVRLQKGDIAVMYNVYFFKDAAIIRSESQYEINNLLAMMNENSAYKILLHGHANGNASGKIITMGESKNYFSLTDIKEGHGSSKKLSEERAGVIRQYLIDQGIGPERMEIKAWGGKRPLYDKNHSQAHTNVRVEVEILEN